MQFTTRFTPIRMRGETFVSRAAFYLQHYFPHAKFLLELVLRKSFFFDKLLPPDN